MAAAWTTSNLTNGQPRCVADVPRGGIGFFSFGQLSCFGTLYLHSEQDRIASLGKIPCGLAHRVRGIKCVCLTEETVETLYPPDDRARDRSGVRRRSQFRPDPAAGDHLCSRRAPPGLNTIKPQIGYRDFRLSLSGLISEIDIWRRPSKNFPRAALAGCPAAARLFSQFRRLAAGASGRFSRFG